MSSNATKWAWEQQTGSITDKTVLLSLADWASPHAGHTHELCWYGQEKIAIRCECSTKTIERALERLEEKRLIKRVARYSSAKKGGRTSDFIYLNIDGTLDFTDKLSGKGLADNLSGNPGSSEGDLTDKLSGGLTDKLSEEPKKERTSKKRTPLTPQGEEPQAAPESEHLSRPTASVFTDDQATKAVRPEGVAEKASASSEQASTGKKYRKADKTGMNTRRVYSPRFEAIWSAWRSHPILKLMDGDKSEAAEEFDRLPFEDQTAVLLAIPLHAKAIATAESKSKHFCRFFETPGIRQVSR